MIKNTLYEPLLFANVIFVIGNSKETAKEYDVNLDFLVGCVFFNDKTLKGNPVRDYIVWIESPDKFYDLMHEVIHLVRVIFVDRKIPVNEFNDEIFAYYHGYFFKKMWKICGKYLDKNSHLKENWDKSNLLVKKTKCQKKSKKKIQKKV